MDMGIYWVHMVLFFAINGNIRLKLVSMVMYALKICRYGYIWVFIGMYVFLWAYNMGNFGYI